MLATRDKKRGEAALAPLRNAAPRIAHSIRYADLSRLAEVKRVAAEIAAAEPRIDVLINNAGALFSSRQVTEDGLQLTFALHHVAYFVLTFGLRERLIASAPARMVHTASDAHGAPGSTSTTYNRPTATADSRSTAAPSTQATSSPRAGAPVIVREISCRCASSRELKRAPALLMSTSIRGSVAAISAATRFTSARRERSA